MPSVPTTIEKQSPGGLKTLALCVQPKITHDLSRSLRLAIVVALVGNLLLGTLLLKREWFANVLIVLTILGLLWSLLLPATMASSSTATHTTRARVEKSAEVGSYEVSVLGSNHSPI